MKKMKNVIKRNGDQVAFDESKIKIAIGKAFNAVNPYLRDMDSIVTELASTVVESLDSDRMYTVEEIQDKVEAILMRSGYTDVAKAYVLYRQEHKLRRATGDELSDIFYKLTFASAKDADIKRENANIDGDSSMGTMLKYGTESAKLFINSHILPPDISAADKAGDIHIHDKDFYLLTETCCQIDLVKLFKDGFSTGHGYVREPSNIQTYAALACIALQANQNEMHGGQSIPNFDYAMADGVRKTFQKMFKKHLTETVEDYIEDKMALQISNTLIPENILKQVKSFSYKSADFAMEDNELAKIIVRELDSNMLFGEALSVAKRIRRRAEKDTEKDTHQAMESLIHNLNTMHSRAGAQVPFSSINYGTDMSPEGQLVIKMLLQATDEGLGNGETPIFPVQIFKVKAGVNFNKEDVGYYLFRRACEVSAKRLFPNFSFLDAPYNLQYYKEGDYNTEVAYMGCRTRVMGNVHDRSREITCGRGNLSFTSINLPRIGIEAKGDWTKFYETLDERINLVIKQLLHRLGIQSSRKVKNYPFLMQQGVWIDSDKLDYNDEVREVLKHGTLSVGFIGLAETLVAMTGKHHGESEESQKIGLEIISHMRKRLDDESQKTGLNFTLLATPAEGLSGRFVNIDRVKYGNIKGVTDREYYTNSFHVPVYFNISVFKKLDIEAPYHALCNAGHISYVELDGDLCKNIDAFETVIRYMQKVGIGYGSINHPVDRDPLCGYTGVINDVCPRCGRRDGEGLPLSKLNELRKKYPDMPHYEHCSCCK